MNNGGFMQGLWRGIRLILIWQFCNILLLLTLLLFLAAIGGMVGEPAKAAKTPELEVMDGTLDREDGVIVEICVSGVIAKSEDSYGYEVGSYETALKDLKTALDDKSVRGVLLRVDSPGGTISAADHLLTRIKSFKADKAVPFFAFYEGVAASGGVYVSVASDRIIAEPTCLTGSVGVIMSAPILKGLMDKLGVKSQVYRSADFKDMGSMMREPSDEENRLLQGMVDSLYRRFVDVVAEGRAGKISREKLLELKSSFFLADRAMDMGLVDQLGYIEDAYESIREAVSPKHKDMAVVRYKHKRGWLEMLELLEISVGRAAGILGSGLMKAGPMYILDY